MADFEFDFERNNLYLVEGRKKTLLTQLRHKIISVSVYPDDSGKYIGVRCLLDDKDRIDNSSVSLFVCSTKRLLSKTFYYYPHIHACGWHEDRFVVGIVDGEDYRNEHLEIEEFS